MDEGRPLASVQQTPPPPPPLPRRTGVRAQLAFLQAALGICTRCGLGFVDARTERCGNAACASRPPAAARRGFSAADVTARRALFDRVAVHVDRRFRALLAPAEQRIAMQLGQTLDDFQECVYGDVERTVQDYINELSSGAGAQTSADADDDDDAASPDATAAMVYGDTDEDDDSNTDDDDDDDDAVINAVINAISQDLLSGALEARGFTVEPMTEGEARALSVRPAR